VLVNIGVIESETTTSRFVDVVGCISGPMFEYEILAVHSGFSAKRRPCAATCGVVPKLVVRAAAEVGLPSSVIKNSCSDIQIFSVNHVESPESLPNIKDLV